MANYILNTENIYATNATIKKLDSLIREDIFPRNAWDTPMQQIDDQGTITVDWKIENVSGLKKIRFTVDHNRNVELLFFNGKEYKAFNRESDYAGFSWLVRQQMAAFKDFYRGYLTRVETK
jgi:hypothetical protein